MKETRRVAAAVAGHVVGTDLSLFTFYLSLFPSPLDPDS
jgi:predicted S18 family serine protease